MGMGQEQANGMRYTQNLSEDELEKGPVRVGGKKINN